MERQEAWALQLRWNVGSVLVWVYFAIMKMQDAQMTIDREGCGNQMPESTEPSFPYSLLTLEGPEGGAVGAETQERSYILYPRVLVGMGYGDCPQTSGVMDT